MADEMTPEEIHSATLRWWLLSPKTQSALERAGYTITALTSPDPKQTVLCQKCNREWPVDSEQAACVELFAECITCRAHHLGDGDLEAIVACKERRRAISTTLKDET